MSKRFAASLISILSVPLLLTALGIAPVLAQTAAPPPAQILFANVRIFDGKSTTLSAPSYVLVRGGKIEKISTAGIPVDRSSMT